MPRERIGLAIGKDRQGYYPAVVAMSTEINPTDMRDLAYLIGREIGNHLTEEEQIQLRMKFKGKQTYYLDQDSLGQAWNDFYQNRPLSRVPTRSLYTWSNPTKALQIAQAIAEYMHISDPIPEPQVAPARDPDLPDNVFISANVPL